jgi:hypothetical protein
VCHSAGTCLIYKLAMTNPTETTPPAILRKWLIAVTSPLLLASFFCYVVSISRSVRDHVPLAFDRIDLTLFYGIALAALVFTVPLLLGMTSLRRTSRATIIAPRASGRASTYVRLAVAAALCTLSGGICTLIASSNDQSVTPVFIPFGVGVVSMLFLCRSAIATTLRRWLAGMPFSAQIYANPMAAAIVRPYRGRGRLVESHQSDPLLYGRKLVLGVCATLALIGMAMGIGAAQAEKLGYDVVFTPGPEIVVRQYGDSIVTAPIDLQTEQVTLAFTPRLIAGTSGITLYPVNFRRPISEFTPAPRLLAAIAAAKVHAQLAVAP